MLYRFRVAAKNSIGQGEWSDVVSFYAASAPANPVEFTKTIQKEDKLTLSWRVPPSNGGCPITGYRIWMENVLEPGMKIVYNGIKQSTQTSFTLQYPTVKPGEYYKFLI